MSLTTTISVLLLGKVFRDAPRELVWRPAKNRVYDAVGGVAQPLAVGVFADGREYLAHGLADSLVIDGQDIAPGEGGTQAL